VTDVFISYKREERARVERLAQALSDLDLNVWFDIRLTAGKTWSAEIDHHAHKSWALIACWTEAAIASKYVRHEVDIGIAGGKLVPLFLSDCDLPADLSRIHALDFRNWNGDFDHPGFTALVDRLSGLLPTEDARKQEPPNLSDRAKAIAAGRKTDVVARTRDYLIALAREKLTVAYSDAQEALGIDLETLVAALDENANINRIHREPPLCVLVVAKKTGLPGRGFFQKHCFLSGDDDDLAEEVYDRLVERVFAYEWSA
jgi:hypothetical protein